MKKITLLLLAVFIISCESSDEWKTIEVNNYSVELPTYLSESKQLNDDASLQYQNIFKEVYIIVIDENKKEMETSLIDNGLSEIYSNDFEGYTKLLSTNLATNVEMKNKTEKDTLINSLQAKILKFDGKVEDIDVFYEVVYINGIYDYYQVFSWTLLENKSKYKETIDKMVHSFKVKKNSKKRHKGAKK